MFNKKAISKLFSFFEVTPQEGQVLDYYQVRYQNLYIQFSWLSLIPSWGYSCIYMSQHAYFSALINFLMGISTLLILFFYRRFKNYFLSISLFAFSLQVLIALQHISLDFRLQTILMWSGVVMTGVVVMSGALFAYLNFSITTIMFCSAEVVSRKLLLKKIILTQPQILLNNTVGAIFCLVIAYLTGHVIMAQYNRIVKSIEEQKLRFLDSSESNSALLSILTHDVANPLAIIIGYIDTLLSTSAVTPLSKIHISLNKISIHAKNIANIINTVRTLKASSDHKIPIKLTPVCLIEIIEKSVTEMKARLEQKNLTLVKFYNEKDSISILADPVSLQFSVINNLLSNAIKFSKTKGKIKISVARTQDQVILTLQDEGIGIPSSILPHLFSTTKETNRPGTEGEKGTGFGLPLVKMFVERYGGSISVQSHEFSSNSTEQGSTFTVRFIPVG